MRISFNQRWEKSANINGFGYARQMCEKSLENLGHTVNFADPTADIEINFIQPQHWIWSGVDYRIAYLPWESTKLQPGWRESLNSVDEVWTPSPLIAEWMEDDGVKKPIYVYEHGVEEIWTPVRRNFQEPLHVFHPDFGAVRKRADLVARLCYGDPRTALTVKIIEGDPHPQAPNEPTGFAPRLAQILDINYMPNKMSVEELVGLYHMQNLMVYPTAGEGFGLSPLQAIATGMPTIITKGWAPYENLFPSEALVDVSLVDVPKEWQHIHPGKWFEPDVDSLRAVFEWHLNPDNYEQQAAMRYELANLDVFDEWRWDVKTAQVMEHLL